MMQESKEIKKPRKRKGRGTPVAIYRQRLQLARSLLSKVFQLSEEKSSWILYVLQCGDQLHTYVGITTNFVKRLSSHVGFRASGAFYTKRRKGIVNHDILPWTPVLLVTGFKKDADVRRCERLMHQPHKKKKFREWRSSFCFRQDFGKDVQKGSGIHFRQLALMFALETNPSWIKSVTLHWIQPELRHPAILKKLEDRTDKVLNENVSEGNKDFLHPLNEEYKDRRTRSGKVPH